MQPFPTMPFFLMPVLRALSDGSTLSRAEIAEHVAAIAGLAQEQVEERTTRGNKSKLADRVHWAAYYLNRAQLISLAKSRFTITQRGKEFLSRSRVSISKEDLKEFPEFIEFLSKVRTTSKSPSAEEREETEYQASPIDELHSVYSEIQQRLEDEVLQKVLDQTPSFFEHLVKDLLIAMGYGWSAHSGQVIGKSGDGGIDVVLSLDRLGLTKVYVQAKKWQGKIGAGELRDFVGALTAHGAERGVFITTSDFQPNANEYLARVHKEIALVNGDKLAKLCVEFGVGVSELQTFVVKKLDSDYFAD